MYSTTDIKRRTLEFYSKVLDMVLQSLVHLDFEGQLHLIKLGVPSTRMDCKIYGVFVT